MKQAIIILLMVFSLNAWPQSYPPKETPELEFALQLKVTLGEAFSIDNTQRDSHHRRHLRGSATERYYYQWRSRLPVECGKPHRA